MKPIKFRFFENYDSRIIKLGFYLDDLRRDMTHNEYRDLVEGSGLKYRDGKLIYLPINIIDHTNIMRDERERT